MHYEAYGLSIESALALPQFRPSSGIRQHMRPDVVIRDGYFQWDAPDIARRISSYDVNPERVLINMPGVACYRIAHGGEIVINRAHGAYDGDVRIFLISSAFGAVLHQRGLLVLHGSSVEIAGRAAIFLGESGSGKSTLAAALVRRGHRLVSDDISALSCGAGAQIEITPSYPNLKLWRDSIEALDIDAEHLGRVRQNHNKFFLPSEAAFAELTLPVGCIFVLEIGGSDAAVSRAPIGGGEKINEILSHTFRPGWVARMGIGRAHFAMASRLAREVPMQRVIRPAGPIHLEALVRAVERAAEADSASEAQRCRDNGG